MELNYDVHVNISNYLSIKDMVRMSITNTHMRGMYYDLRKKRYQLIVYYEEELDTYMIKHIEAKHSTVVLMVFADFIDIISDCEVHGCFVKHCKEEDSWCRRCTCMRNENQRSHNVWTSVLHDTMWIYKGIFREILCPYRLELFLRMWTICKKKGFRLTHDIHMTIPIYPMINKNEEIWRQLIDAYIEIM